MTARRRGPRPDPAKQARDAAMAAAYRAGRTLAEIAADKALSGGISTIRVHFILRRDGVEMRPQRRKRRRGVQHQ